MPRRCSRPPPHCEHRRRDETRVSPDRDGCVTTCPRPTRTRPRQTRAAGHARESAATSEYDRIAALYDPWSRSVVEDVAFYVEEARKAAGRAGVDPATPVVELGVGTGRIAVPVAEAGVARDRRRLLGGDARRLPRARRGGRRRRAPRPARRRLPRAARDRARRARHVPLPRVPAPARRRRASAWPHCAPRTTCSCRAAGSPSTSSPRRRRHRGDARPLARARAGNLGARDWDERRAPPDARRARPRSWRRRCAWPGSRPPSGAGLLERAGFEVEACYGWFDRRPYTGGEDSVWLARRP